MLDRILVDGVERTVRDLTLGEACTIRERLDVSYLDLDPVGNEIHRAALLEAFLARTLEPDQAKAKVEAMTTEESEALVVTEITRGDRKGQRITVAGAIDLAYGTGVPVTLAPSDGVDDTLPEDWSGPLPLDGDPGSTRTASS